MKTTRYGYTSPGWRPVHPRAPVQRSFNPEAANPLYQAVLGPPAKQLFGVRQQQQPQPVPQPRQMTNPAADPSQQAAQAAAAPFQVNYQADPILQRIQAFSQMNVADAKAQALARRKQLAIDFGDPDFARQISDELTATAARDNPFSVTANLRRQRADRTTELEEQVNKANLFYGGHRGKFLSDLERNFLEAQANAQATARGQLSEIEQALLAAIQAEQNRRMQAEADAYGRAAQFLLQNPPSDDPPSDGSDGGGDDPLRRDPWDTFVDTRVDPLPAWLRPYAL